MRIPPEVQTRDKPEQRPPGFVVIGPALDRAANASLVRNDRRKMMSIARKIFRQQGGDAFGVSWDDIKELKRSFNLLEFFFFGGHRDNLSFDVMGPDPRLSFFCERDSPE
jgi:hypothetical protein